MTREEFNQGLQDFAKNITAISLDGVSFFSVVDLAAALEICPVEFCMVFHKELEVSCIRSENGVNIMVLCLPLDCLYKAIWAFNNHITQNFQEAYNSVDDELWRGIAGI